VVSSHIQTKILKSIVAGKFKDARTSLTMLEETKQNDYNLSP